MLILLGIFSITITMFFYNNANRKETLNIIKMNGNLYFNISNDQLFFVEIHNEPDFIKFD